MEDVQSIAGGGQPGPWTHTFTHPDHGKLTFTVKTLPTSMDWLQIAARREEIAPGVTMGQALQLAEAIAGIVTLMDRPVLREERVVDPDTPGHEKIVKHFYDPGADTMFEFPMIVWGTFNVWRIDLLSPDTKEQVKNSSGSTTPDGSASETVAP